MTLLTDTQSRERITRPGRHVRRRRPAGRTGLVHVGMIIMAAVYLVPITFALSSSLRVNAHMYDPSQWIPRPATLTHYVNLVKTLPSIGRYAWNTTFIAVLSTAGTLASSSLAGYALARFRFAGSRILLIALLVTLMIPPQVTLIPIYTGFRRLDLINTPWPLIIPMLFGTPFVSFFFRQYFLTLPRDLDEAALVDGANWFQVFWKIAVPIAKPAFVTMGILTLILQWNSYFGPSVYLQRPNEWVLTQGIVSLIGQYTNRQGEIMAGTIVMSLPMIVLYILGQRYVVRGISAGGIKG